MALGALADMTKDTETARTAAERLLEGASLLVVEVKRQSMEALFAYFDYAIPDKADPEDITESSLFNDDIKSKLKLWLKLRTNDGKINADKLDILNEVLYVAACLSIIKETGAEKVYISQISQGSGIQTKNDELSLIPSPHTEFLCKMADIHIKDVELSKELITPGGAALLYVLGAQYQPRKMHNIIKSGYGAGAEDLEIPNILRAVLANDSDDEMCINFEAVISEMYTEFGVFAETSDIVNG